MKAESGLKEVLSTLSRADRKVPSSVHAVVASGTRWRQDQLDRFASSLFDNGFVVIENYIDRDEAGKLGSIVASKLQELGVLDRVKALQAGADKQLEKFRPQAVDGAQINFRASDVSGQAYDTGMITISASEKLIPALSAVVGDPDVLAIVRAANGNRNVEHRSNVVYFNDSVTNPRGLHMDGIVSQYKAFLYLTDVNSTDDGPYSFVKGSHKPILSRSVNAVLDQKLGRSWGDAILYNPLGLRKFLAARGTLIISNQRGYHGGVPQKAGHRRIMLVQNLIG